MKVNKNILITFLVAVIGIGAGFFAGMKYQQGKIFNNFAGRMGVTRFGRGMGGNNTGFRPNVGSVLSIDDKSITIKMNDGSSKIILVDSGTTFSKTSEAQEGDIKVGDNIGVFGTANSDGSITAQNVQINPMFRMMSPAPSQQK